MTALEKARRWVGSGARRTALVIVPLAVVSASSQAGTVAPNTIFNATSAVFSTDSIVGGNGGTSGFTPLPFFNGITGARGFGSWWFDVSDSADITFALSGDAGEGSTAFVGSKDLISWNFKFTTADPNDRWFYTVYAAINQSDGSSFRQNYQVYYDSTGQDFTGTQTIVGSMLGDTPQGYALSDWTVNLDVYWIPNSSGGGPPPVITLDIPAGGSIDVTAVPEPESWKMAIASLVASLGLLWRRGRGN